MTSEIKQNLLRFLQDKASYNCSSKLREEWLNRFNRNEQYIRGNQWLDPVLNLEIVERGVKPFTINKIARSVKNILSLVVKATKRIKFSPTTTLEYDKKIAELLKYWSMNVSTQNQHSFYSQLKSKDMIVGGLGWSHFFYDKGEYVYEYKNSRNVFGDPDDLSPKMSNQKVIVTVDYVSIDDLINRFPKSKSYLEGMITEKTTIDDYDFNKIGTIYDSSLLELLTDDIKTSRWVRGKSLRVVEVYYKKNEPYYECIGLSEKDKDKQQSQIVFETFDKNFAIEKAYDNQIYKKEGTRIYKGVYTNNELLDHGYIAEQVPNQKYLPLVPIVLDRDYMGVPFGLVDDLIPIQDMINHLASGIIHFKDKVTVFIGDPVQNVESKAKEIKAALAEKYGVIFSPQIIGNDTTKIIEGTKNGQLSLSLLQYLDSLWEKLTGLHDEFSGIINRETSGMAIEKLTINTLNSQSSLLLAYDQMLVSEGVLMLDTLKGTENINQLVRFYKLGENQVEYLNSNISLLKFEVFCEAGPNFASSAEEEKFLFSQVFNSPNPSFYLNSEYFLRRIGFSDKTAFEASAEWKRVQIDQLSLQMEAQMKMEQAQNQQNIGDEKNV